MKRLIIFALILTFSISTLSAKKIYVNGKIGNDKYLGETNDTMAVKTITRAVKLAVMDDEIIIIGKHEGKQVTYSEGVVISEKLSGLMISGDSKPIIDGKKVKPKFKHGLEIYASFVTVKGLVIQNFLKDGAGIATLKQSSRNVIEDNRVTSCNYGILLDGPYGTKLNGNHIENIGINQSNNTGGIGINILPSGRSIEENKIGLSAGNVIINAEMYGLSFGDAGKPIVADFSNIENNRFENCGNAGLAFFNVEGIVKVKANSFSGNNSSIYIGGIPIDTFIFSNVFHGSSGKSEIFCSIEYDGYLLFDIWKNNENQFLKKTYAAVKSDESEVVFTSEGGFIRTNNSEAQSDAGDKYKVISLGK